MDTPEYPGPDDGTETQIQPQGEMPSTLTDEAAVSIDYVNNPVAEIGVENDPNRWAKLRRIATGLGFVAIGISAAGISLTRAVDNPGDWKNWAIASTSAVLAARGGHRLTDEESATHSST